MKCVHSPLEFRGRVRADWRILRYCTEALSSAEQQYYECRGENQLDSAFGVYWSRTCGDTKKLPACATSVGGI